jgi:hypothetical protein
MAHAPPLPTLKLYLANVRHRAFPCTCILLAHGTTWFTPSNAHTQDTHALIRCVEAAGDALGKRLSVELHLRRPSELVEVHLQVPAPRGNLPVVRPNRRTFALASLFFGGFFWGFFFGFFFWVFCGGGEGGGASAARWRVSALVGYAAVAACYFMVMQAAEMKLSAVSLFAVCD